MAGDSELHYAIVEELSAKAEGGNAALAAAVESLSAALGVDLEAGAALSYKPQGASLGQIFAAGVEALQVQTVGAEKAAMEADPLFKEYMKKITDKGFFKGLEEGSKAYLERWAKAAGKFKEKQQASGVSGAAAKPAAGAAAKPAAAPASAAPAKEASAADKARAEELKAEGNKAIQAKDFRKAEGFYTQAIALVSTGKPGAVYYCNRAAARAFLNDDDGAKADAAKAVELDPSYAKAHSRLGYACYQLGEYQQAVDSYTRALELDPSAAASKEFLDKAQAKLKKQQQRERDSLPTADGGASGFGGGMPDLSSLAGMMGGAGGPGGLGGLMNNPGFMQMAQSMMQNPEMMRRAQEMMSNPEMMAQAQSMLSGMGMGGMPGMGGMGDGDDGAGGDGATDLNDLMSKLGGGGGGAV